MTESIKKLKPWNQRSSEERLEGVQEFRKRLAALGEEYGLETTLGRVTYEVAGFQASSFKAAVRTTVRS